jgi:hypothetical protein
LVVVAGRGGDAGQGRTGVLQQAEGALEAQHSRKTLGCYADLLAKSRHQMAVADTGLPHQIPDAH